MDSKLKKSIVNDRRKSRTRFKLKSSGTRIRLVFNRSNRYLSAQVIDDVAGKTLAYATTFESDFPKKGKNAKNKDAATELGKIIAKRAIEKGVKQVMLDRSGLLYHGRIAAFADSAREGGLEF